MALTLTVNPAEEPVSIEDVKVHLSGISSEDTDSFLHSLIAAARMHVENYLNRVLVTQTWEWRIDDFSGWTLRVPKAPLQSVSSIAYVDGNGDAQTLASTEYTVDAKSDPGRIQPAYGKSWPTTRPQMNAVTVTFIAGYGDAADVPAPIKNAILMTVAELFKNREDSISGTIIAEVPMGVKALLNPYLNIEYC